MNDNHRRKIICLLVLAGCLGIAFFCLAYPIYVIRPFRRQGAGELAAALVLLRFRPVAMVLCIAVALFATTLYWRIQHRTLLRIVAALAAAGVCLFAGLSSINIYEKMFHPLGRPAFVPAAEAKLDGDEMVIAVDVAHTARAYPIRSLSYHHIVNDEVGGIPIVATY